ncbi:Tetratricopeptide repeat protein 1 [Toxocara canis]|uniref:Tetratricopeptide repeat protein 1 n=2 Tax=Toxocara canis TaxID=6265 RepID=A0A0B2VCF1_TOXCA|nr:Tetratricopeptide repeat protein 1 [Toxocara canis]VDM42362.1 unnamed protein product [Toxocara canis]
MAEILNERTLDVKEDGSNHEKESASDLKEGINYRSHKGDLDESRHTAESSHEETKKSEARGDNAQGGEEGVKGSSDDDKKKQEMERRELESFLTEEERIQRKDESGKMKSEGNRRFGEGNWHEAAELYTKALDCCPLVFASERSVYLSNRAACYIKLSDWDAAIKDCTEAMELGALNEKPLERRAHCYSQTEENYDRALQDYEELMKRYPNKEDMLAKLKDLGNMCLRPFGLSTDNFQLTPQPGGGYSISIKK